MQVQLKEGEEEPTPHLDEGEPVYVSCSPIDQDTDVYPCVLLYSFAGEHIDVRLVPVMELYAHLQAFEKLGYTVDAR